jgi:hypothetical protein
VQFSQWIDGGGGFLGDNKSGDGVKPNAPTTAAHTALLGTAFEAKAMSDRLMKKSLLRIRTLGPFRYDIPRNMAHFEIATQVNPVLPNNIEVTRFLPQGGKDVLVCQRLDIEFFSNAMEKSKTVGGPGFKKLIAAGDYVLLAAGSEQLQAQGTSLTYESDPANRKTVTILQGAPLSAVRGKNVLNAGAAKHSATLVMTSIDPPPMSKAEKVSFVNIIGAGQFDLYDEATGQPSQSATWKKSLEQVREVVGGVPLDRFTFDGDGSFVDAKGTFRLKADTLKLWLKNQQNQQANAKPLPYKLHGLGHVEGFSDDAIIERTDLLEVLFQDAPPPPMASALPPAVGALPTAPPTAPPLVEPVTPTAKTKAKPVRMSARKVDVTLLRQAAPVKGADAQYELTEARCDDRVDVVQESSAPARFAVGLDIKSAVLILKKRLNGHEMTVLGEAAKMAKVRFENNTVSGGTVVIDQPNNRMAVDGPGWLRMPSSTGLAGGAVDAGTEMTIHWQSKMAFRGANRTAEFVGQVQAVQAPVQVKPSMASVTTSNLACHEMNVTFDKPVYFNQSREKKADDGGDAKVERVVCTPASEDGDGAAKPATSLVFFKEETIDRASNKPLKATQIEAKTLVVDVKDNLALIAASGPGVTRTLSVGDKDGTPAAAAPPPPGTPVLTANAKADKGTEMKLTVIRFNGRLDLKDQKGILQTAVFRDTVRVAQVPSDNLLLAIDEFAPAPPRSLFLKCNDTMTVSTYKAKTAVGEESRTLEALEAAEVKTDDYIGMGHRISFDGRQVILRGHDDGQATLYRRQRSYTDQDYKSGNPLIYNTKTGQISGAQSSGGSFTMPKK